MKIISFIRSIIRWSAIVMLPALFQFYQAAAPAQSSTQGAERPFVVEYYYKARWGYADEFIRLFKKNHYPVLKKEKEMGRILQVTAASPKYHSTEDGRWDYRVTIIWKNVEVAHDNFDSQ